MLLCWLKQNLACSVFVHIRQRGEGRAKKRCRPANTKQHWACACSCALFSLAFLLLLPSSIVGCFASRVLFVGSCRSLFLFLFAALVLTSGHRLRSLPVCCASCRVVEPGPHERPKSSGADRRSLCFFCVRSVPTQCFA